MSTPKPCPNCLRTTVTELVPATFRTHTTYPTGLKLVSTELVTPPYRICTWCGYTHGYEEDIA